MGCNPSLGYMLSREICLRLSYVALATEYIRNGSSVAMFSGLALTCTAVHVLGVMADAKSFLAFGTDPSHVVRDATLLTISHA